MVPSLSSLHALPVLSAQFQQVDVVVLLYVDILLRNLGKLSRAQPASEDGGRLRGEAAEVELVLRPGFEQRDFHESVLDLHRVGRRGEVGRVGLSLLGRRAGRAADDDPGGPLQAAVAVAVAVVAACALALEGDVVSGRAGPGHGGRRCCCHVGGDVGGGLAVNEVGAVVVAAAGGGSRALHLCNLTAHSGRYGSCQRGACQVRKLVGKQQ
mmetsp:Transcript_32625/g.69971  ORF Transcript_32625/g.69971 Transcript_32625/m.69971 type:complete len:211 (+) Transcript_32625:1603-2235(+)